MVKADLILSMFRGFSAGTSFCRRVSASVNSLFEKRVHSAFTASFTIFFALSLTEDMSLPFSLLFTASSAREPMSSLTRSSTAVAVLLSRFGSCVFSSSSRISFRPSTSTSFRAAISSFSSVSGFSSSEG